MIFFAGSERALVRKPTTGVILAALLIAGVPNAAGRSGTPVLRTRPNILIIVTDDQREGLGMMPRTRELFRAEGTDFRHAFATTPVCCPSRASLLTGQYAHNHGVRANTWKGGTENYDEKAGLPYRLKSAGYTTASIGKYLNDWPFEEPLPYFDRYVRTEGRTYYDGLWNVNGLIQRLPGYSTRIMADAAGAFVAEQASSPKPWFLLVSTVAPHRPFVPENRYASLRIRRWKGNPAVNRKARARGKPAYVRRASVALAEGRGTRKQQFRTLRSVDDLVDRIFTTLELTSQDRDTLAFFVSDNGIMWGEYGLREKGYPYTPSVRVPMMMRWPARLAPGRIDRRLVGNIDVAPTVLDAAGVEEDPIHPMDGKSLLDDTWNRKWILLEYWRNLKKSLPWASIRSKRWQYIENYQGNLFVELYNLRRDPWQLDNLLRSGAAGTFDATRFGRKLRDAQGCAGSDGPFACP